MSNKLLRIALVIVAVYMLLNLGASIIDDIVVINVSAANREASAKVQQETKLIAPYRNTTIRDAKTIKNLSVNQIKQDKILDDFLIAVLTAPGEKLTPALRRTLMELEAVEGKK